MESIVKMAVYDSSSKARNAAQKDSASPSPDAYGDKREPGAYGDKREPGAYGDKREPDGYGALRQETGRAGEPALKQGGSRGETVPKSAEGGLSAMEKHGEPKEPERTQGEKKRPDSPVKEARTEEEARLEARARHILQKNRYSLIARYAVASVVICYILLRFTENANGILTAAGHGLETAGLLLAPLFWGFVLAYVLAPMVGAIEKRAEKTGLFRGKNGKGAHTFSVAAACLLTLAGLALLLSIVVSALTRSLKIASLDDIVAMVQSFASTLEGFRQMILKGLGKLNLPSTDASSAMQSLGQKLSSLVSGLSSGITGALGQIGGILSSALFAVIFAIYFLLDAKGLKNYWNRVLLAVGGKKASRKLHILIRDADDVFSGYIRGQLIDALLMAFMIGASLSLLGVRYAVIIGILSGIGNLIPYVGPVVAYASTILVCLLSGDLRKLLIAIVVLFVIQTVDGNVINPRLLSSNIDVHPMLVIAALLIGGAFGGVVGMLFAVPVAAFFKIQFDRIIDRLLRARLPEEYEALVREREASGEGPETGGGKRRDNLENRKRSASRNEGGRKKKAASAVKRMSAAAGGSQSRTEKIEKTAARKKGAAAAKKTAGGERVSGKAGAGAAIEAGTSGKAGAGAGVQAGSAGRAGAGAAVQTGSAGRAGTGAAVQTGSAGRAGTGAGVQTGSAGRAGAGAAVQTGSSGRNAGNAAKEAGSVGRYVGDTAMEAEPAGSGGMAAAPDRAADAKMAAGAGNRTAFAAKSTAESSAAARRTYAAAEAGRIAAADAAVRSTAESAAAARRNNAAAQADRIAARKRK